ncbi:MAG: hypothetical protein KF765_03395 [Parvibaculaceae bacterium]|nr:hypothetical protein [Parvibaculaceae bacterium]
MKSLLWRFARDEGGVISVMGAMALMLALAVTMIVVDTGAVLSAKRAQQAATDAAALGAVRQLDSVQAAAEQILFVLNDFDSNAATATATPVYFVADPSRAPDQRYFALGETASDGTVVDAATVNAVRVRMRGESPTYFARLFGFGEMTEIETVAVAALTKHTSFSAGTRLASLDAGIANQVLGGLLGTTLNLSLVDYNALAGTTIDALTFLDALAIRAGLEAGSDTYGDLLGTTVTAGQLLDAAVEVLNGETAEGNPSVARVALQSALAPVQNGSVPVDGILGATPYSDRVIGSVQTIPGSTIPIGVLDLLTGTATLLGQGQAVGFGTNVNVGSLASVNGTIRVGAPMAHMAVGKVGDSVQTSQVDVQLTARIQISIPLVVTTSIDLPIFVRAASGNAAVQGIPCTPGGTLVTLSGTTDTGLARVGVGENGPSAAITLTLLFLPILNVPISGNVPIASSGPTSVNFSESEFGLPKQTASQVNVISNLGGALTIGGATGQILSGLTSAIASALTPLDQVLDAVLASVGVKLGSMDMIVHGAKCHAPVLVR